MRPLPIASMALCVFAMPPSATRAQDRPLENPPIVQVGVFATQPDGSVGGYAVETGEKVDEQFAAGVLAGDCRYGAGKGYFGDKMPAWGADAWEIHGQVLSMGPDQATVQLDWRRVRSGGQDVQQPAESRQLTLPLQQLVTLDTPIPSTNPQCAPRAFGARYAPRLPMNALSGARAGGAAGMARVSPGGASAYDVELWLVHSRPGQADAIVPATARMTNGFAKFDFTTVQVPVDGGAVDVRISGQLRAAGAGRMLSVRADRVAMFTALTRPPRDREGASEKGNAVVMRPWPGPDDVLELQMPPVELRAAPAVPDKFAVRLRVRPAK